MHLYHFTNKNEYVIHIVLIRVSDLRFQVLQTAVILFTRFFTAVDELSREYKRSLIA